MTDTRIGRPPLPPARRRSEKFDVRITPQGLAALDSMRGTASRGEFVRNLIAAEYTRRNR